MSETIPSTESAKEASELVKKSHDLERLADKGDAAAKAELEKVRDKIETGMRAKTAEQEKVSVAAGPVETVKPETRVEKRKKVLLAGESTHKACHRLALQGKKPFEIAELLCVSEASAKWYLSKDPSKPRDKKPAKKK